MKIKYWFTIKSAQTKSKKFQTLKYTNLYPTAARNISSFVIKNSIINQEIFTKHSIWSSVHNLLYIIKKRTQQKKNSIENKNHLQKKTKSTQDWLLENRVYWNNVLKITHTVQWRKENIISRPMFHKMMVDPVWSITKIWNQRKSKEKTHTWSLICRFFVVTLARLVDVLKKKISLWNKLKLN
jgi:hypothetical protein